MALALHDADQLVLSHFETIIWTHGVIQVNKTNLYD